MATWGDFIAELPVQKTKTGSMVVPVDDVISVWEQRNQLAQEVLRLREELAAEREGCAVEVEEFAAAIEAEPDQPEYLAPVLRAAASLIRQRGETESEEVDQVAEEAPIEAEPAPEEV